MHHPQPYTISWIYLHRRPSRLYGIIQACNFFGRRHTNSRNDTCHPPPPRGCPCPPLPPSPPGGDGAFFPESHGRFLAAPSPARDPTSTFSRGGSTTIPASLENQGKQATRGVINPSPPWRSKPISSPFFQTLESRGILRVRMGFLEHPDPPTNHPCGAFLGHQPFRRVLGG